MGDASEALPWIFTQETDSDAEPILKSYGHSSLAVPAHWKPTVTVPPHDW